MSWKPLLIGSGDKSGRMVWILAAAAVLIVAVGAVGMFVWRPAPTVGGQTPAERIESISRLVAERAPGTGKAIAAIAVGDSDPRVRCAALVGLRTYARPEIRAAVEQGTKDEVSRVRAAAALTLGKYTDGAAAERLGEMLARDRDDEVRLAAARGLARCNSRKADDLLVAAMKGNSSPAVRKRALELLLEGTGVTLMPEPDPHNAGVWGRHVRRVLRHINATRANESSRPRADGKEQR